MLFGCLEVLDWSKTPSNGVKTVAGNMQEMTQNPDRIGGGERDPNRSSMGVTIRLKELVTT